MSDVLLNTRTAIINGTIDLVAQKGLEGFSVNDICKYIDVAKGTVYFHFESKEELLYQCFLTVNKEIADLFKNKSLPLITSKKKLEEYLHDVWMNYFNFMVENGNRSLFYYAYRDSENLDRVLMKNNEAIANEMSGFNNLASAILKLVSWKLPTDYIIVHIIDGTGIYVKHILKNHISKASVEPEKIWTLIFSGIKGLL